MGKDSLLKSTSKKKTSTDKAKEGKRGKTAKRAVTAKEEKVKKGVKTKKADQKKKASKTSTTSKKTGAAQSKSAVKAKVTAKRRAPGTKGSVQGKAAEKKLILKKFKRWKPKKIFRVKSDKAYIQGSSAPPFVSGKNDQETDRIRQLLFKKFEPTPSYQKIEQAVSTEPTAAIDPATLQRFESIETKPFWQKLDPAAKLITLLVTVLVLLFIVIVAASSSNRSKYYIQSAEGAVEIWQGTFAPLGKERIIVLPGSQVLEPLKDVYTKSEIFSFVFNYYLEKADTLQDVPGMPDFEGIKLYLKMAQIYAMSNEHRAAATSRLNNIELMTYLYKADVAASKGTVSGIEDALNYLNLAAVLELDAGQSELLAQKIQTMKDLLAALKSTQPGDDQKSSAAPLKK